MEPYMNLVKLGDAMTEISKIFSMYSAEKKNNAEDLAKEITKRSKAISIVNGHWSSIMNKFVQETDPQDISDTINNESAFLTELQNEEFNQAICDVLGIPYSSVAYKKITNGEEAPAYDELQQMKATMTALCDEGQVTIDELQQKFKDLMTNINSTNDKNKEIRRRMVQISQGR